MSRMMNNLSGSDRQAPSARYVGSVSPDLAVANRRAQRAEDHARALAVERALDRIDAVRESSFVRPLRSHRNAIAYRERAEKAYRTDVGVVEAAHRRRMGELGAEYSRKVGEIRDKSYAGEEEMARTDAENQRIDREITRIDAMISLNQKLGRVDYQVRQLAYEEAGVSVIDYTLLLIHECDPSHPKLGQYVAEHRGQVNALNVIKLMDEVPFSEQETRDLIATCKAKVSPEFIPLVEFFEHNVLKQTKTGGDVHGLPGYRMYEALAKERGRLDRSKIPVKTSARHSAEIRAEVAEAKTWFRAEEARLDQELARARKEVDERHAADLSALEYLRRQLSIREGALRSAVEAQLIEEEVHRVIGLDRMLAHAKR